MLEPQIKNVDHSYSDMLEEGKKIYEELFAEKLRALVERLRPRDLYDVIHLYQQKDLNTDINLLREILMKKCELRSVPFPKIELIGTHNNRKFLESEWTVQLRHQIPELPPFNLFLDELEKVLDWVSNENHFLSVL